MRTIWLGLEPSQMRPGDLHWPLIECSPRPFCPQAEAAWHSCTDALWTSRQAVTITHELYSHSASDRFCSIRHWCVGEGTAERVRQFGGLNPHVAEIATAEGLVALLQDQLPQEARSVWFHSAQARPIVSSWARDNQRALIAHALYDTTSRKGSLPPLEVGDCLMFTSPSCVAAWVTHGWMIPTGVTIKAIGPVTRYALEGLLRKDQRCNTPGASIVSIG
ncbi:MAG: uroporphyrinogen-III synthase [Chlamydiia bacterium]